MNRQIKQAQLAQELQILNHSLDIIDEGTELLLKNQIYTTINSIRNINSMVGSMLLENVNVAYEEYYKDKEEWQPTPTDSGEEHIAGVLQRTEFDTKQLQLMHREVLNMMQSMIDAFGVLN